jgi:hypothetical protein
MGVTRKARVMFTCEHKVKDCLAEWAESENRTVSNLVETLVEEALAARGALPKKEPPASGTAGGKGRGKKGGEG